MKIGVWTKDYVLKWWASALFDMGHEVIVSKVHEEIKDFQPDVFITDLNTWGYNKLPLLGKLNILGLMDEPKGSKEINIEHRRWDIITSVHWDDEGNFMRLDFGWAKDVFYQTAVERPIDVGFAGTMRPQRIEFVGKIRPHVIVPITCMNQTWLPDVEMRKFYNTCKITFQYLSGSENVTGETRGLGTRVWEAIMCGCLFFNDRRELLNRCFIPGKEILVYNDLDDLNAQIDYYLKHWDKASEIIKAGQERIKKEHSYHHRMEKLMKKVDEIWKKKNGNTL